jgi:amidase
MKDAPLHYKTVSQVASLIEAKELSPVELTEVMLARIDAVDGQYLSYATVMANQAMESARAAETAISAGNYLGPLHGVPIAVKDLCFTKGVRTMGGAKVLRDHVPDFDATVVEKLQAAGAVILGKLNLTEGAMAGYNPEFQIPLNPWDTGRWSGASSSGSGVATAAGLCFGSLGSDTGGSIRFPAAACGTVGIKPTWGRVSRYGVLALADSMDHIGPMTRSAADAGIMLQVLAGHDPNDPTSLTSPVPNMLEGLDQGIRGVRIGLDERYITDGVDSAVTEGVLAGIKVLEGLGAEVVQVRMPETPEINVFLAAWGVLCQSEAAAVHRETFPSRSDEYGPWFRGWLERGAAVTGAGYAVANQQRLACNGLLAGVFADIDVLVCPSMSTTAGPVKPEELYGPMTEDDWTWGKFTIPFDFNGAPTISLPCGLDGDRLPLSIQFVGKHLSEPLLCRMGHAFEAATTWHDQHPEV